MDQRISLVTFGVSDMTRAKAFYEAMGWTPSGGDGEAVCFFQMPGCVFGLYGYDALTEDSGQPVGDKDKFGGITISYNVESESAVDALLAQAESCGGVIARPAIKQFWGGYSGYFADLDGHAWEIAYNPHWTITQSGETRLGSEVE